MTTQFGSTRKQYHIFLLLVFGFYLPGSQLYLIPQQQNQLAMTRTLPQARLTEAESNSYNYREPNGPGTYAFGYDIDDAQTGNTQFREEEKLPNGTVIGKYGYVEPDGNVHVVNYIADERGYRVQIENSRDNTHPKAMPRVPAISRPAVVNSPEQIPFDRRPVAIVPNNLLTQAIIAPLNLSPSLNLEVPNKQFNQNFAAQTPFIQANYQNDFNDVNPNFNYQQFPSNQFATARNPEFPNVYFVQRP